MVKSMAMLVPTKHVPLGIAGRTVDGGPRNGSKITRRPGGMNSGSSLENRVAEPNGIDIQ